MSFYHAFRAAPGGRHVLRVCRAEACKSVGGDALASATLERLGVDWTGRRRTAVTVEPVYCLGLCASGRRLMLDDELIGRARRRAASSGRWKEPAHEDLRSPRRRGPLGRRRRGRPRDRRRGEPARHRGRVVRNGSRGMLWLEPLVEVETAAGRIGYGPVARARTCPGCSTPASARTRWRSAPIEAIPCFARQTRLTFARWGSSTRCRSPTTRRTAASPACAGAGAYGAGDRGRGDRVRPARPRRRRLPDRHQVADGAEPRRAEVHRLQRRRGRQRHVRRPDAHGGRSVHADRGHGDRRARRRRDRGLHLHPLGVPAPPSRR